MAVWAHPCHPCHGDEEAVWYVSAFDVAELDDSIHILHVKVGPHWRCAILDRQQRLEVEGLLLRQFIPTDAEDCAECEDLD